MKTHVIDGVTFVEVDRKAEVGDKVVDLLFDIGEIRYCIKKDRWSDESGISVDKSLYTAGSWQDGYGLNHDNYRVLEPLSTVDTSEASPAVIEMLTSLSRKIVSLESQLRDTQGNVEKLSQELANARHRLAKHSDRFAAVEDKVEMVVDDVVTLDSRSQVLNAINKYYAEGSR